MSDGKFKWLVSSICLTAVIITAIVVVVPKLFSAQRTPSEKSVGEFVYIDETETLHTDRKCSRLNYKGMTSFRISTSSLSHEDFSGYCPKCVSDTQYELIRYRRKTSVAITPSASQTHNTN